MSEVVYDYTINGALFRTKKANIIEAFDEINNRIKLTYDSQSIDIRVAIYKNEELTKRCRNIKTLSVLELLDYHNREVWFKLYSGEEFEGVIIDIISHDKKISKGDWFFIPRGKLEKFRKLSELEIIGITDKLNNKIGTRINVLDISEIRLLNT